MGRPFVLGVVAVAATACGLSAVGTFVPGADDPTSDPSLDGGAPPFGGDGAAPGSDAAPDIDEPIPMDPVAACGRPSTYVDEFADGVIGPEWLGAGGAITESAGRIVIPHGPTAATRFMSRYAVDLRGDRIRVKVPHIDPETIAVVAATRDQNNEIAMLKEGAQLRLRVANGGASSVVDVPYDPVAHKWWQIAEEAGSIRFQASHDGTTWATLLTTVTPAFANVVHMTFTARPTAAAVAGRIEIDRLNVGRPPAPWCKASTFTDSFADGVPAPQWRVIENGACTWTEANGEYRVVLTGAAAGRCAYESETAYDLRASSVRLNVPIIGQSEPQVRYSLRIEHASGAMAEIGLNDTMNFFQLATGATPPSTTTAYGGNNEDFWRIREANGQLVWESSADGATWTQKRSITPPFPLDAVRVSFGSVATAAMVRSISIGTPDYN